MVDRGPAPGRRVTFVRTKVTKNRHPYGLDPLTFTGLIGLRDDYDGPFALFPLLGRQKSGPSAGCGVLWRPALGSHCTLPSVIGSHRDLSGASHACGAKTALPPFGGRQFLNNFYLWAGHWYNHQLCNSVAWLEDRKSVV